MYLVEFTIKVETLLKIKPSHVKNSTRHLTADYLKLKMEPSQFLKQQDDKTVMSSSSFNTLSMGNDIEVLIDGAQTFARYYHVRCPATHIDIYQYMMQAQESIDIVGWELSLSFGLVVAVRQGNHSKRRDWFPLSIMMGKLRSGGTSPHSHNLNKHQWVTLEDVLLSKAASGVRVRVLIWRHHIMSYLNRYLYMGEVTIEREVSKLQVKAAQMGLKVKVFHTEFNLVRSKHVGVFFFLTR